MADISVDNQMANLNTGSYVWDPSKFFVNRVSSSFKLVQIRPRAKIKLMIKTINPWTRTDFYPTNGESRDYYSAASTRESSVDGS